MWLFDKKYCDVCGEKIGLLGNRKLDDGNLCKDCAKKLSPFMTDRRHSTVEEIKQHPAYREENKQSVMAFRPTRVIGERKKVYIDEAAQKFIVTSARDWQEENPDVINISQVFRCNTKIEEHKDEIYRETSDGKRISYNPRRYECEYAFLVEIQVDSPWFSEISFELSDMRPDSPYTDLYRSLERESHELQEILMGRPAAVPAVGSGAFQAYSAPAAPVAPVSRPAQMPSQDGSWTCACGAVNTGKFCTECASPRPQPAANRSFRCDKCGWVPSDLKNLPRFCPQCGDPFNGEDLA